MQHAIVVFTKVPKAGRVKTRLTEERGGLLTPEEAKTLYEACLLDAMDICTAVPDTQIWICYDLAGDPEYLQAVIQKSARPERITGTFHDQGGTFDDCMQYAADYLFKPGQISERLADSMLIVGGDTCGLQVRTLVDAVEKLENLGSNPENRKPVLDEGIALKSGMVASPDQEGGFNLLGYTANTPFDFRTVFYNRQGITALDIVAEKAKADQIPLLPIDIAFDIDLPVDIAALIPILNLLEQGAAYDKNIQAPLRVIAYLREMGFQSIAPPVEGWS